MADLIDRSALLEALEYDPKKRAIVQPKSTFGIILSAPAVDVVEVVRCKDCKRWTPGKAMGGDSLDDMQIIGSCPLSNFMRREKDFCSYGERKET